MKKIGLFLILSIISWSSFSQSNNSNSAFYIEFLGNGILYSLNFDQRFTTSNDGIGGKIGVGIIPSNGEITAFIPLHINYLFGKKHAFEVGLGATALLQKSGDNEIRPSSALMYRYTGSKGFLFRAGIGSTWIPKSNEAQHIPSQILWFLPSISLGYRF